MEAHLQRQLPFAKHDRIDTALNQPLALRLAVGADDDAQPGTYPAHLVHHQSSDHRVGDRDHQHPGAIKMGLIQNPRDRCTAADDRDALFPQAPHQPDIFLDHEERESVLQHGADHRPDPAIPTHHGMAP